MSARSVFVLGGARSGKSALAESLGRTFSRVTLFATARPAKDDEEMEDRIARHRAARPSTWLTLEPPLGLADLAQGIASAPAAERPELVIFDCATLWLAWELTQEFPRRSPRQLLAHLEAEGRHLAATLAGLGVSFVVVSNEAGEGVVPSSAAGRLFRDALGVLNRQLSEACRVSVLLVAGNPLCVRGAAELAPHTLAQPDLGLTSVVRVGHELLSRFLCDPRGNAL